MMISLNDAFYVPDSIHQNQKFEKTRNTPFAN